MHQHRNPGQIRLQRDFDRMFVVLQLSKMSIK